MGKTGGFLCMVLGVFLVSCGGDSGSKVDVSQLPHMTGTELITQYNNNENLFNKNYNGKEMVISGKVDKINKDSIEIDVPHVLGNMNNYQVSMVGIKCYFKDNNVLLNLSRGQQVTIRGKYTGKSWVFLEFKKCTLVQ